MEVEIRKRLESVGLERAAFDWVLKACHPAGSSVSPGLPDMSTASVFRPEFKDTCVVAWTGAAGANWDMIAWRPPGDNICLRYATAPAGFDFTGAVGPTLIGQCVMQPTDWQQQNLYNFSVVPPVTVGCGVQVMTSRPLAWRHQYASVTSYLTASALNDQGTLYVSTFDRPFTSVRLQPAPNAPPPPILGGVYCQQYTTSFPCDENRIMLTDPRSYMAPARDGAYVPLRLCGPSQPFVKSYFSGFALTTGNAGGTLGYPGNVAAADGMPILDGLPCFPSVACDTSTPGYVAVPLWASLNGAVVPAGAQWAVDSGYDNLSQVVFLYRGLAASATVTFKCISGLEVIPRVDSPILQFVTKPVRFSAGALNFYQAVAEEMRNVYPGSFNSLGTILQAVGQAASAIWPTVRSVGAAVLPHIDKALGYGAPTPMSTSQAVTLTTPKRTFGQSTLQGSLRSALSKRKSRGPKQPRSRRTASIASRSSKRRSG